MENMVSPTNQEENEFKDQQNTGASSTSDVTDQGISGSSDPNTPQEEEKSTFDLIKDALEGDDKSEGGGSSEEDTSKKLEGDKKPEGKKDEADDDFEDFTPEERAKMKKATTERFDKLKGLYRESKEKVSTLSTQLEQANVEAGYYRQFVSFLEDNRLSQDEANKLFNIGALMKNDPQKALEALTPYYNELLQITGNILPPDLQQQVAQGYITKQHALELSRHRMSGKTNQAIEDERRSYQQRRDQTQQQQNIATMQTAIGDWERNWSASDPDYAKKKDRVLDRVELLLVRAQKNGTLPKTVDEAVKLANQAKTEVEADLKKMTPQRKQVRTVEGGSSVSNMPDPKNTADVIRRTLNQ